jgi:hypothetical protein
MKISSLWTGLENPELDPSQIPEGEEGVANHPTTRMKELGDPSGQSEEGWATVRVEGRDWGRVLSVGRLGGKVIACFCDEHALVLYVYVNSDEPGMGESVFTVSSTVILTIMRWLTYLDSTTSPHTRDEDGRICFQSHVHRGSTESWSGARADRCNGPFRQRFLQRQVGWLASHGFIIAWNIPYVAKPHMQPAPN